MTVREADTGHEQTVGFTHRSATLIVWKCFDVSRHGLIVKIDKLPIVEMAFHPSREMKAGRKEPFLYLFSETTKLLLARRIALCELPELTAAGFHAYGFLSEWRFGLDNYEDTPLLERFQPLENAAVEMGDRHAAKVFADLIAEDTQVLNSCLIKENRWPDQNAPSSKRINHENPILSEVASLFGRASDFPERLDRHLGANMPMELLSLKAWRSRIGEILCQIEDYHDRPHRSHDILEVNFDLCEAIDARIIGQGRLVFDWDMHKPSKVAIKQGRKTLTTWTTGEKTARNDFSKTGVSIRELFTTKGTFWTVTYRDADDLIDPMTRGVLATMRLSGRRKESLWLKDKAPAWQFLDDQMWLRSTNPLIALAARLRRWLGMAW